MTGAGVKNETIHIVDFGSAHIYGKTEKTKTIKWLQERDENNLVGVILNFLHGGR